MEEGELPTPDHRFEDAPDEVEVRLEWGDGEGVARTTSAKDEGPVGILPPSLLLLRRFLPLPDALALLLRDGKASVSSTAGTGVELLSLSRDCWRELGREIGSLKPGGGLMPAPITDPIAPHWSEDNAGKAVES